jgi:hypothetical protein
VPSGVPTSRARACASTTGSLSASTIRASGAMSCTTSCRFGLVGMPVPMSRNCRTPSAARVRHRAAHEGAVGPCLARAGLVLVEWTGDLGNVPEDRPVRHATGGFGHALASAGRLAACSKPCYVRP